MGAYELSVVGLVGADFSGSTILSAVLDGLEGVQSVGETHWIVDRNLHCRECCPGDSRCMWDKECRCHFDPNCPVFTTAILEKLRALPEGQRNESWWKIIGEAAQSSVVISSDKRPSHFERLGLPNKYIFTFKDPVAHVFSRAKRMAEADASAISDSHVEAGIAWLVTSSAYRVDFLQNCGKEIVLVKNEDFSKRPQRVVTGIARHLGVEPDVRALEYWNHDHHYIGGNFSVRQKASSTSVGHAVRLDSTPQRLLTSGQQERVRMHDDISELMHRIDVLSGLPNVVRLT